MQTKVLVTGANGPVGTNAIKRLLELNIPVRAMVRKSDDRSAALETQGAEVVIGDMTDFNTVSAAMKGITGVLFIYPVGEDLLKATAYVAQAAREENVELLVNISQRTAGRNAPSRNAQDHWLAEEVLNHSGVPVTHLVPPAFLEWLIYFAQEIKDNNRYISPFGDARIGFISAEDIGRSAAAILAKPEGHAGQRYNIYGPAESTGEELSKTLSDVLAREITYAPVAPEAFGDILRSFGATDFLATHITTVGHMFQSGEFRGMNDNVKRLTGTNPISPMDFIIKHIQLFQ
jgi:NAD(P)H dehydrogenase (quinone)